MISFFLCLLLLIGGYFVYGKIVENTFAPDDRETPAVKINDGVDYVVMPQWKLFLVQLLNIAGLGPIFGAMQGALWGPIVFLWITFGTIFAGGVHDYFSGMLSERNNGTSISEVCGIYLGNAMKNVMRVFSVVLLVMVGTVFAVGPAGLIVTLFKEGGIGGILASTEFWLWIILAYYFIATFISIDKIIGRIYPLFGICPITSGDTAFRSARLVLADWFKIEQSKYSKRLLLCVPLLGAGAIIGHLDYTIVWRYFSWTNQTLAMIVLWTASMYLFREKKNYWLTAVPATFMSAVSMTYFFYAKECLGLGTAVAYPAGIILAAGFLAIFLYATRKPAKAAK